MKYKFIKFQNIHEKQKGYWMLECDNLSTLADHNKKYMSTSVGNGLEEYFSKESDFKTGYAKYIDHKRKITGEGVAVISTNLETKIIDGKLKAMNIFGKIYLREIGSYTIENESLVKLNEIETDSILYPHYTSDDIKLTQFNGGNHFYAKIGNFEVCDDHGDIKWNTKERAMEVANEYLLNKL